MADPQDGEQIIYELKLYVSGAAPNSLRAIANVKKICEQHIPGQYMLEVIDIYQQPDLAKEQQLVALPLLLKRHPLPSRRLIGDMSDSEKVLRGLGIEN